MPDIRVTRRETNTASRDLIRGTETLSHFGRNALPSAKSAHESCGNVPPTRTSRDIHNHAGFVAVGCLRRSEATEHWTCTSRSLTRAYARESPSIKVFGLSVHRTPLIVTLATRTLIPMIHLPKSLALASLLVCSATAAGAFLFSAANTPLQAEAQTSPSSLYAESAALLPPPAMKAYATPVLTCCGSTESTITLQVCAGATSGNIVGGAPGGFSIQ